MDNTERISIEYDIEIILKGKSTAACVQEAADALASEIAFLEDRHDCPWDVRRKGFWYSHKGTDKAKKRIRYELTKLDDTESITRWKYWRDK